MKKKYQQIKPSGRGQTTPRAQDFLTKLDWRISLDMGPKWGPPTVSPRLDLGTCHEQSWVHRADPLRSTSCEVSRWASHSEVTRRKERKDGRAVAGSSGPAQCVLTRRWQKGDKYNITTK